VNSEFFWRAVLLHCRKFSAHQEMRPPEFSPNKFGAQKKFVTNHWLKPVAWLVVGATSKFHATDFSP
jgi:hypothetical protein